jgi:REP element-mobilizing transposase RayT
MKLSTIGVIADILWYEIKNHATNVELGEFVVMPNHIHAILVLNEKSIQDNGDSIKTHKKRRTIGKQRIRQRQRMRCLSNKIHHNLN